MRSLPPEYRGLKRPAAALVALAKPKAKAKAKARPKAEEEEQTAEATKVTSAAKRPKTLRHMLESGASEHGGGAEAHIVRNKAGADSEHMKPAPLEAEAASVGAELFPQSGGNDHALIKWLRSHEADAGCKTLLQQIGQWSGKLAKNEMRSLAQAQGIRLKRQQVSTTEKIKEAARHHFEAAIAQEKGRLACFQFNIAKGASEHLLPVPEDTKHAITLPALWMSQL